MIQKCNIFRSRSSLCIALCWACAVRLKIRAHGSHVMNSFIWFRAPNITILVMKIRKWPCWDTLENMWKGKKTLQVTLSGWNCILQRITSRITRFQHSCC